ncbi:MAG: hypothetical protein E7473_06195 [Ruminococcaceae bacterium]|nr:hypothetical protein [Oscillospiraceae bacterium]
METIAEKLAAIAENEGRVYDTGEFVGKVKGECRMSEALNLLYQYQQAFIDKDEAKKEELGGILETWDYWEGEKDYWEEQADES